jgi:pimeloyl-ACP methyl ester carboxylesterase
LINKKNVLNYSEILTLHGNFDKTNDKANILLLLPKTRGPFGVTKFKKLIEKKFNLLEYDDVLSDKLNIFNQSETITFKDKALAVKNALTKWGNVNFHIVCHSTGCGLGTFLAKNNEKNCKSIILISPWNKKDDDFKLLQKRRIENARTLDSISFLKSEYKLLYSPNYIEKFKIEFSNYISMQKNKKIDYSSIEKRLKIILDCNIGKELYKLELPKLLINAVDDKLMKIHHGQKLNEICKNSKLISLESGGHMLTETRAKDLNMYIIRFINTIGNKL